MKNMENILDLQALESGSAEAELPASTASLTC